MSSFKGQVVLVVNTASRCGLTPQYRELQGLWERYKARGLVVLGVPCNDFGAQEPGTAEEIVSFCQVNYDIDFPLTSKQSVIGADAHPFYKWVAEVAGEDALPKWNFHKYLIGPNGDLVQVFGSKVPPEDRKSVVEGKSVSVRVELGGSRIINKKKNTKTYKYKLTNKE